jgi:AraC family transcriptional regulator
MTCNSNKVNLLKKEPGIQTLTEKKLIGKRIEMTFSENKTFELWRSFMPHRKEIKNNIGSELYSIQIYGPGFFNNFNPNAGFEKWAAIEVTDFEAVPDQMDTLRLSGGLYAVFIYQGAESDAAATFRYIFETWLPCSDYLLDDRPHFEKLGEKYKNDIPESEEEIWIPIERKLIDRNCTNKKTFAI